MSMQSDLLSLQAALIGETLDMLATEWADRITWLNDEGILRTWDAQGCRVSLDGAAFCEWLETQDLDAAQDRHRPEWAAAKRVAA